MKYFIKLLRLQNIIIAEVTLFVLFWILRPEEIPSSFWIGTIVVFLIMAGANILNDLLDLDTDRVNKPHRPIVDGKISLNTARFLSFAFFSLAVILSFALPDYAMRIALFAVFILIFYTSDFKKIPFWGNFIVAMISALLVIFGGILLGKPYEVLTPAILAFLVHLLREIVKDYEDLEGDQKANISTIATEWDFNSGRGIIRVIGLLLILFILIVAYNGNYGVLFGWLTIPLIVAPLGYFLVVISPNKPKTYFSVFSNFLKFSMFIGLFALGIGKWFTI